VEDYKTTKLNRRALLALISALLVLNLLTFLPAFSQVSTIDSGCCSNHPLAKDFSAFYIGAWRLYHDPSQIYTHGLLSDGEPPIYPQPEQYKYLPSFLLIVSPFLLIHYPQALALFDIIQFMFLPLIGILVYNLTKEKGWAVTVIAEVLVLLLPAAAPGWGFSVGYFWQWKEGQSKVLETLLLTSSFYFGARGRAVWSGFLLGIAFFDPRFALVATPLFLAYNTTRTSVAIKALFSTLILSNLALFLPGVAFSFLGMVFSSGLGTALYPYAIIPLAEIVFLSFINYDEIRYELHVLKGRVQSFNRLFSESFQRKRGP
jgi:hypothetical protein